MTFVGHLGVPGEQCVTFWVTRGVPETQLRCKLVLQAGSAGRTLEAVGCSCW